MNELDASAVINRPIKRLTNKRKKRIVFKITIELNQADKF